MPNAMPPARRPRRKKMETPPLPTNNPHFDRGRTLFLIDTSVLLYNAALGASVYLPVDLALTPTQKTFARQLATLQFWSTVNTLGMRPGDSFLAVGDGDNYFRYKYVPEYKGGRQAKPTSFGEMKGEVLAKFGTLIMNGYEADDLIAAACRLFEDEFDNICIVTVDSDLLQLCTETIYWVSANTTHRPRVRWSLASCFDWLWTNKGYDLNGCSTLKEAVIKDRWERGDSSDNYERGADPIVFDLSLSPIHQEPNIKQSLASRMKMITPTMLETAAFAVAELDKLKLFPCFPRVKDFRVEMEEKASEDSAGEITEAPRPMWNKKVTKPVKASDKPKPTLADVGW
jgi:hypothetical protein